MKEKGELKEMEYGNGRLEVLAEGEYLGHNYLVLNMRGMFPTAYVRLKDNEILNHYDDYEIEVHGGLTFLGTPLTREDGTWLGWDYGHYGDYTHTNVVGWRSKVFVDLYNNSNLSNEKKWTTEEVQEEAKSVIEQLIERFKK